MANSPLGTSGGDRGCGDEGGGGLVAGLLGGRVGGWLTSTSSCSRGMTTGSGIVVVGVALLEAVDVKKTTMATTGPITKTEMRAVAHTIIRNIL
tara:strand:- start:1725 stop:2006 length:282 start_codon:yes stop_codon:yes gene_type:complete